LDDLDSAVAQLKQWPIQTGPLPELIAATAAAMSQEMAGVRKQLMLRYWLVAAAVLILLMGILLLLTGPATPTFAQVAQRVEQTHTLTGKTDGYPFYIKNNLQRWEGNTPEGVGPWTHILDSRNQDAFDIIPNQKAVYRDRQISPPYDLYKAIRDVAANPVQTMGEKSIDGQLLIGYSGSMRETGVDGITTLAPVHVWVDPKTKLPVRLDKLDTTNGKIIPAFTDLQFDVLIDDALFAMVPPAGYRVVDRRDQVVQHLRAPATTQEAQRLILYPGLGIGKVRLGDSPSTLVALLGQPEAKEGSGLNGKEQMFKYPSLGLRIFIAWDHDHLPADWSKLDPKDMTVSTIYADSADVPWPGNKFPGTTDRGISIGMTRRQVETAYGKPGWENTNNADYRKLGLAVFYRDDGVTVEGFLIIKPSEKPIFGP
jgi:hypothetical protein